MRLPGSSAARLTCSDKCIGPGSFCSLYGSDVHGLWSCIRTKQHTLEKGSGDQGSLRRGERRG